MSASRIFRRILCCILGVSRWHASTFGRQPYREVIEDYLRASKPRSILEIGCGFGDIICAAHAKTLWATDASPRVLLGARICHPWDWLSGRVLFRPFRLGELPPRRFDAVICIGYLHGIDSDTLRSYFRQIFSEILNSGGLLIFDVVADPPDRHHHDPQLLLRDFGQIRAIMAGFKYGRSIVVATALHSGERQDRERSGVGLVSPGRLGWGRLTQQH